MASAMPASEGAGLLTDDNDQMDICNEASVPSGVPTGSYSNQMDVCATSSPRDGDQAGGYSSQMDICTTPSPIRRQTAVYKSINPSPYQPPPRFDAGQLSGQPFGRQTSKPRLPPWLARHQASGQPPFGRRVVPAAPPPRTNSVPKESDPFLPPPDQKRLLIDRSRGDYYRNNLFCGRSSAVQTPLRGSYRAPQVPWSPHVPHIPQTPQVPRKRPLPSEADDYATENLPSKKAMQQHVPGAWPNTPAHGDIFMEDADASSKGQTALTSSTTPGPTTHAQQSPPCSPVGSPLSGVYPHSHQSQMAEVAIPQEEAVGTAQDGGYFNLRNWVSWSETVQRVYAAPRGMQRTVQTVMRAAVNLAGSFKRQAVGIIERTREHLPRRRRAAPSSPTRASLRLFPEEQRRRMRDHRWRRDRGYPTVDSYPFPELNFDFLQSPPASPSNADFEATPTHHVTSNMELETTPTLPSFPPINPPSGTSGEATERLLSTLSIASPSDGASHATTENRPFRPPVPFDPAAESNDSMIDERPSIPTEENESLRDFLIRINSGRPAAAPSADEPTPAAPTMLTSNPLPSAAETRDVLGHVSPNKRQKDRPTFAPPLAPWIRPATPVEEEGDVIPEIQPAVEEDKENEPPVPPEISDEELLSPDHFREEQESFLFGPAVSAVNLVRPNPLPIPPGRTDSVFAREWKKIEKERVSKERSERKTRTRIEGPAVHRLTTEWERRVTDAMRLPNSRKIASTLSGDPLTRKDLASCYTQGTWLNDEVINAYLAILIDYLRRSNNNAGRHDKPLFHAFNTFFFSNLRDRGYQAVRRWANRAKIGGKDLLNVDTIFVPVHNQAHWTLIVVRPSARTIENFDSLGSVSKRHVDIIKSWLEGELGADFDEREWEVLASRSPQQTNGSDCGAFLLSTAKAVAVGIDPLSYGAADIPLLRLKVVAEVVNGALEGDFEPLEGGL